LLKDLKRQLAIIATLVLLFSLGLNAIQPIFSFSKHLKSHISYTLEEIEQLETSKIGGELANFSEDNLHCFFQLEFPFLTTIGEYSKQCFAYILPYSDTPRYIFFQNLKLYC
jgi:hypothetical protein